MLFRSKSDEPPAHPLGANEPGEPWRVTFVVKDGSEPTQDEHLIDCGRFATEAEAAAFIKLTKPASKRKCYVIKTDYPTDMSSRLESPREDVMKLLPVAVAIHSVGDVS